MFEDSVFSTNMFHTKASCFCLAFDENFMMNANGLAVNFKDGGKLNTMCMSLSDIAYVKIKEETYIISTVKT